MSFWEIDEIPIVVIVCSMLKQQQQTVFVCFLGGLIRYKVLLSQGNLYHPLAIKYIMFIIMVLYNSVINIHQNIVF